jgi:hypothetical protein
MLGGEWPRHQLRRGAPVPNALKEGTRPSLSAYGLPTRPRKHRGRHSDLPLAHHARFDLASGCTFDLWADDVPTCAVELRADEVWVQPEFGCSNAAAYWRQRLEEGMAHNLGLVIAKAIQGQLVAGVSPVEIVRQAALFGAHNRDGWGTGMTILTAVGSGLAILPEEETYLALFHGVRRVAIDCDGEAPARQRSCLSSRPSPAKLKRWLRRWASVRHREAASRTVLTAIAIGAPPAVLAILSGQSARYPGHQNLEANLRVYIEGCKLTTEPKVCCSGPLAGHGRTHLALCPWPMPMR